MGRARRDQRDAIRKQRAVKRRKRGNDQSDEEDTDNEDGIVVLAKRLKSEKRSSLNVDHVAVAATSETSDSCEPLNLPEEKPASSSAGHGPGSDEMNGTYATADISFTNVATKQTPRKPLDKIERMRLKKQQQKARRREKKAAKNGLTS